MANSLGQAFHLPLFEADATLAYTADTFRGLFDILSSPGRRDDQSLAVSQSAVVGMTVAVSPGAAVVAGTSSGVPDAAGLYPQGLYGVRLDAAITGLTIPTAPASGNPRTDAVYLQVADKTVVGSGLNEAVVKVQSPFTSLPVSSLLLATVSVPAGATTILNGQITRSMVWCAPSSTQLAVARSPYRAWSWTPPASSGKIYPGGYGQWYIPDGQLRAAYGSSGTFAAIAGHTYQLLSNYTLYAHQAEVTLVRAALMVNGAEVVETYASVAQVQDAWGQMTNVSFPTTLAYPWKCPATGTYTLTTAFAANNVNFAGVTQPFTQPFSTVMDLG